MAGHSAAAPAAGYLYQTNWALVDLLRKSAMRPDQAITLELHDDVAWTACDDVTDAVELLQVKLHTTAATAAGLGDMSVDMWKTLKIWMDRRDAADPQGPELVMVTTSVAKQNSAAYLLHPGNASDGAHRDVALATKLLKKAARDSNNGDTHVARQSFLALEESARRTLLNRVRIHDGQTRPEDLQSAIHSALTFALPSGGAAAEARFIAQVWHWWAKVAIDMLAARRAAVSVTEVLTFVRELRDRYTAQNLPTTVPLASITEEEVMLYKGARFVYQLNLVQYASSSLRQAIIDYHRAITQETHWLSDNLLDVHELRSFEEELRFEWTREFDNMVTDLELDHLSPEDAETAKVRAGRRLLNYLLSSTSVTVRTHYSEGFFSRGKRHELAGHDDAAQRIGWHPDFVERLESLTASVQP